MGGNDGVVGRGGMPTGQMLGKVVGQQVLKAPRKDLPRQIQAGMKEEIRLWRNMREESDGVPATSRSWQNGTGGDQEAQRGRAARGRKPPPAAKRAKNSWGPEQPAKVV